MATTATTGVMLPPLRWLESPNCSDRAHGVPLDLIVVHDTEGGYDSACAWFANGHSQVSAHIVLKEDASEATQMVRYSKKAWHCATFNSRSIGLEMAGFAKAGYGEQEWAVAARIVAFLLQKHDLPIRWAHGYIGMSAAPGAFSGLRAVVDQEHFTDAETVVEGRVCGTHSAEFLGFAPTGRNVELPFVAFYRFDADGKLASERVVMDLGSLRA